MPNYSFVKAASTTAAGDQTTIGPSGRQVRIAELKWGGEDVVTSVSVQFSKIQRDTSATGSTATAEKLSTRSVAAGTGGRIGNTTILSGSIILFITDGITHRASSRWTPSRPNAAPIITDTERIDVAGTTRSHTWTEFFDEDAFPRDPQPGKRRRGRVRGYLHYRQSDNSHGTSAASPVYDVKTRTENWWCAYTKKLVPQENHNGLNVLLLTTTGSPITVQAVPADLNFSALATGAEAVNAIPASATFSAGIADSVAIAPQEVAASVTFSSISTLAEALQAIPGTFTSSAVDSAAFQANPSSANTTFSSLASSGEVVSSGASLVTFSSVGSVNEAAGPGSATIIFSAVGATSLPIVTTVPPGSFTASAVDTVSEGVSPPSANSNFSSLASGSETANIPSANTNFSSVTSVSESVTTSVPTTTFSSAASYSSPITATATSTFTALASFSFVSGSTVPPANVQFDSLAKSALLVSSTPSSALYSGGNVSINYILPDIPGWLFIREITNSSVTGNSMPNSDTRSTQMTNSEIMGRTVVGNG